MDTKVFSPENQLEKTAQNAGRKIGAITSDIAHSTSQYVKNGREYVAENPVKGIALAAMAGAMVGSLITISMRRR